MMTVVIIIIIIKLTISRCRSRYHHHSYRHHRSRHRDHSYISIAFVRRRFCFFGSVFGSWWFRGETDDWEKNPVRSSREEDRRAERGQERDTNTAVVGKSIVFINHTRPPTVCCSRSISIITIIIRSSSVHHLFIHPSNSSLWFIYAVFYKKNFFPNRWNNAFSFISIVSEFILTMYQYV